MKKLYYTVYKYTETIDTIEECTGYKLIHVYKIVLNTPKLFFKLEVQNEVSSTEQIQEHLIDIGYDERKFELIEL